jgi:hypothetical protein
MFDQVMRFRTAWGFIFAHMNHREGSTVKSVYGGPACNPRGYCDFMNGVRMLPFEGRKKPPSTNISRGRSALLRRRYMADKAASIVGLVEMNSMTAVFKEAYRECASFEAMAAALTT